MWAQLTAGLDGVGLAVQSPRALGELGLRVAPLKALFVEMLAGPHEGDRFSGVATDEYAGEGHG